MQNVGKERQKKYLLKASVERKGILKSVWRETLCTGKGL